MKRKGVDGRNSEDREPDIWEETATECNDEDYAPQSFVFEQLHSKFAVGIDLSLPKGARKMTAETTKKMVKDLFAKFRRSTMNWRGSGNGAMGQADQGDTIRLIIRGTEYTQQHDEDDDEVTIRYVDDDRFKFCRENLSVAYLWAVLEMIGLTSFALQSAKAIGLVCDEDVSSARGGSLGKSTQGQRKQGQAQLFESIMNKFPEMMSSTLATYMPNEDQNLLLKYEDQYRKSFAVVNQLDNELEEKALEFMKYKLADDAKQSVVELQDLILQKKQTRLRTARAEAKRWYELRRELREKMEEQKQSTKKEAKFSDDDDDHDEEEEENDDDDDNNSLHDEEEEEEEEEKDLDDDSDGKSVPSSYDFANDPSYEGIGKLANDNSMYTDDDDDSSA